MKYVMRYVVLLAILLPVGSVWAVPNIQHWVTEQGLRVYFVESDEIPMLDIRLLFDAGSARDPDGKAGLARVAAFMMGQSAAGLSADEMAEGFASVGAGFGASASTDSASLSLRTLTESTYFNPAIELFLKAAGKPDFREPDFERGKRQFLIALEAEKADPGALAAKAYREAVYRDHPYARPAKGTTESLAMLEVGDLKSFYNSHYVNRNGVLTLVGAISRPEAEELAVRIAGVFETGEAVAALPEVMSLSESVDIRKPYPSQQAHVLIGTVGIKRDDPDRLKLLLANHILGGGGFTSRLVKQVRQDRGYVYSIYSYFSPQAQRGSFTIGMQTRGSQVDDAIKVSRDTLAAFLEEGPTEEEFAAAKANITGRFPLGIAGNGKIVQNVSAIGFYDLPLDFLDTYIDRIKALERDEVMEAFKRHVDAEKLVTVVVGGDE